MKENNQNFNKYCEFLRKQKRWMGFMDMVNMINELLTSLSEDHNFSLMRHEEEGFTVITNRKTGERSVILEPRAAGASLEKNIQNTLQDLKKLGYSGNIVLLAPTNKNGMHWTLNVVPASITQTHETYFLQEIDSLTNGRQNDGFSCGIHTMEAASAVIKLGYKTALRAYSLPTIEEIFEMQMKLLKAIQIIIPEEFKETSKPVIKSRGRNDLEDLFSEASKGHYRTKTDQREIKNGQEKQEEQEEQNNENGIEEASEQHEGPAKKSKLSLEEIQKLLEEASEQHEGPAKKSKLSLEEIQKLLEEAKRNGKVDSKIKKLQQNNQNSWSNRYKDPKDPRDPKNPKGPNDGFTGAHRTL